MTTQPLRRKPSGTTLLELLVIIAVIGVIASLMIPVFSSVFGEADEAKSRRNAQSIVNTFNSATSAGVTFTTATLDGVIGELTGGKIVPDGPLAGARFSIGSLKPEEKAKAVVWITFFPPSAPGKSDMLLSYNMNGG